MDVLTCYLGGLQTEPALPSGRSPADWCGYAGGCCHPCRFCSLLAGGARRRHGLWRRIRTACRRTQGSVRGGQGWPVCFVSPFFFFPPPFFFLFFFLFFSGLSRAPTKRAGKYDQSLRVLRHVMEICGREGSVESAGSAERVERVERSQPHAIAPCLPRPRQTRVALGIWGEGWG